MGEQPYVTAFTPDASVALEDGYSRLRITLAENEPALSSGERLLQTLHGAGIAVASLTPEVASLEQTFADLTRDENGAETP